jgi:photosystem II stability/assembly factor-like uncharacterized protein
MPYPPGRGTNLLTLGVAAVLTILGAGVAMAQPQVRTFEDEPVGAVPAGCVTPEGAAPAEVSDLLGYRSAKSLRINDQATDRMVRVACAQPAQQGAELTFQLFPNSLPNGLGVDLLGEVRDIAGQSPVFHLSVTADGAIKWWDAWAWSTVAPPGTVPVGRWSTVRLVVPGDNSAVRVFVDGRDAGEGGPVGIRQVTSISGFGFSSFGTAPAGDEVFLDDVGFGPTVHVPPRHVPFVAGEPTLIAEAPTPVQMPNTAVLVPRADGGSRVLLSYPEHHDDSAGAGNEYVYSDDGGQTWTSAQAANPMPDAPSFGMTRLRDGSLLAVNYHTYMTPGSDNRLAEVDSAVSTDNGTTWTRRAGSMTAPEPMRPIADITDRPGVPLGGFVLTHSVLELDDGTLLQAGYGYYANDPKYRQIVLASTDHGLNWTLRATVAYDPDLSPSPSFEGYCEGAIERTADGSLLIVMRTGSYLQSYTARSTDNGATWSPPEPMTAGPDDEPVAGIYPTMTRLANGALVLLVGRPGLSMLLSPDGTGDTWTRPTTVDYQNSANGTFLVLDDEHLLAFGDRGPNWGRPTPDPYQVWVRPVRIIQ